MKKHSGAEVKVRNCNSGERCETRLRWCGGAW